MAYNNPITVTFSLPRTPAEFISAHHRHERYQLRSIALVAAFSAIPLNIIASICNSVRAIATIHGVALIPLLICIAWTHVDLSSPPQYFRSGVSPLLLILVDFTGFLGFLTLVIANGIAVGNLSWEAGSMFYSYASVPWLVICTVQLLLVGHTLLKHTALLRSHSVGCECDQHLSASGVGKRHGGYTPLTDEQEDEEASIGRRDGSGSSGSS